MKFLMCWPKSQHTWKEHISNDTSFWFHPAQHRVRNPLSLALAESASQGPSTLLGFIFFLQRTSLLSVYTDSIVCWERATFFRCHPSLCFSPNFSPPVLCYLHLSPTYILMESSLPLNLVSLSPPVSPPVWLSFCADISGSSWHSFNSIFPFAFFGGKNVWTFAL